MSEVRDRLTQALAARYRIERELGQGGMATVYLAADLKHDRKVAIKVLKPELAAVLGAERFVQEIKTTAALQHPHILPLFDSGEADSFLYYVMPYIEGETIREKLNRETQFGIDEAVRITTAIADALDYAHRHGVIHRDIKPENILLYDGRPMVMDFGIALAVSAAAGGRMTETGLSLGTPHYMSPEQATAEKEITGRSDVYSLASVLYEMLSGHPPHVGSSAQQIIMRIIAEDARPVTDMRRTVPAHVSDALAKALEKLPADRFESARAFADALADHTFSTAKTGPNAMQGGAAAHASWWRDRRSMAAIGVAVVAAIFALVRGGGGPPSPAPIVRFGIPALVDSTVLTTTVRTGQELSQPVIAPDGRHLAFAVGATSGPRVFVRSMATGEIREIAGGGYWPLFSPTGEAVAFFREAELWRLDLTDARSAPTLVSVVQERPWDILDAAWHPDGRILVAGAQGVWAVRPGAADLLIAADSISGRRYTNISVLADGRLLLEEQTMRGGGETRVAAADGSGIKSVLPGLRGVRVIEDILIYRQSGALRASRFDARNVAAIGEPVSLQDSEMTRVGRSIAWAAADSSRPFEPVWVTRSGQERVVGLPQLAYRWPRLSPDGSRIAFGRPSVIADLRVVDLRSGTTTRLDGYTEPAWMPDGRSIFTSSGNRPYGGLTRQVADGSRAPDTLLAMPTGDSWPTDVSPDSKWLAWYGATLGDGDGGLAKDPNDIFFLDLATRESRRLPLPGEQRGARFSPDGRWVAYESSESGVQAIHIRPWPALDANFTVSGPGSNEPIWSRDGRELFFRQRDAVMVVSLKAAEGTLERSAPLELFRGAYYRDHYGDQSWDMAPDGRFLLLRPVSGARVDIDVTLNWIEDVRARLDRRVP